MLNETLLYLLVIGFFSLVHTRRAYDSVLAFFVTCFGIGIFTFFLFDWKTTVDSVQSFVLDSFSGGDIKLEIVSSVHNYVLIFPFFLMTILALLNNLSFKYEPEKKYSAALFIFNIAAFIMLIVGNNLIQVITFVFVIDIFSQLLIKNSNAGRRYSIYNLVADMGLFLVLAMLEGKLASLDVGNISHYYETGHHRDFIMFMLMISLCIKFGFFLFHGYWFDLKSAKFHNLYFLPYLSTPMAALILFIKFYPLLVVSPSFLPTLNIVTALTMFWGTLGVLFNPQIKDKFVYFNMLHIAFIVKLVEASGFLWNIHFSCLLVLYFMFNLSLYYLHYEMDRGGARNRLSVYMILISVVVNMIGLEGELAALYLPQYIWWFISFGVLWIVAVSFMFVEIFSKLKTPLTWHLTDYRPLFVMSFVILFCIYICSPDLTHYELMLMGPLSLILLSVFHPVRFMKVKQKLNYHIRQVDLFDVFYKKCIDAPLKHAGFLFNILIDFIFLERTFSPIFVSVNNFIIQAYRKASRIGIVYYLICSFMGVLLAVYFFWTRGMQ